MERKTINTQGRILDFCADIDYYLLNEYIDILAARYPMISVTSIGQTVRGRRIPMLTVGRGKKSVLYIGGQAGTETASAAVLLRYINELCEYITGEGRIYNCSMAYLFATRTVNVIPMLNPDGAEYRINGISADDPLYQMMMSRGVDISSCNGNARGISLKDNYGQSFEDMETFEPETGAVRNYLMFNRDIRLALTFVSGYNGVTCTHEGTTPPRLNSIGKSLASFTVSEYRRKEKRGTLCDFCANELVIPSFEISSTYSDDSDIFGDYLRQRAALFLAPTLI